VRTSSQRTKTLTITEAAVLSLLAIEGESSGYDLLRQARKSVANIWAPAKTQLYAVLPRLVASGLATQRAVVQERRPDKQIYRITAAGRAELQRWLDDPDDTAKSAFFLRLFVGGLADQDSLLAHVERFRERDAAELERLRAIVPTNTRTGHDAYHWFLLELGIEEYEQRIRWADRVLESLRELAR
jgi:DNA-binding PadR family transcriptional regulator